MNDFATLGPQLSIAAVAGFALSVFFEWFPYVRQKFDLLDEQGKRIVVLASIVITTIIIYGLGCIPSSPVQVFTCTSSGVWDALLLLFVTLTSNQGTHGLVKKSNG